MGWEEWRGASCHEIQGEERPGKRKRGGKGGGTVRER